jgi:hypothetical protein
MLLTLARAVLLIDLIGRILANQGSMGSSRCHSMTEIDTYLLRYRSCGNMVLDVVRQQLLASPQKSVHFQGHRKVCVEIVQLQRLAKDESIRVCRIRDVLRSASKHVRRKDLRSGAN